MEVALNTGFRGPSLVHGLALTGADLVVTDAPYLPLVLKEAAPEVPLLTRVVTRAGEGATQQLADLLGSPPIAVPSHRYPPGDPALVLFTSGSTGPSKGCLLPNRFVVRQADHFCGTLGLTEADVLYAPFPLFHADGAIFTLAAAFSIGATAALSPRFSVSRYWDECRKHGVTVFDFMGATLTMLYKQPAGPRDREHAVRLAWGVPAPEWAEGFAARFGIEVVEVYGLSDVGIVLYNQPGEPPPAGSCGRPIEAFEVALHDEDGIAVPVGEVGEIVVRPREQHTILTEYVADPEATAEAFRGGWFRTGDLARADDAGYIYFVGRTRDIIRRRGENISPFELEQVLLDHPDVLEVAAYGVPSELTEEDVMVTLVVRPGSGTGRRGHGSVRRRAAGPAHGPALRAPRRRDAPHRDREGREARTEDARRHAGHGGPRSHRLSPAPVS